MRLIIPSLIVSFLYLGLLSAQAQHREKQLLLPPQENRAQHQLGEKSASPPAVDILRAWATNRILFKEVKGRQVHPPPAETVIKANDGHTFLAIEIAFKKGEAVGRIEPVQKTLPDGKLSLTDLVYVSDLGRRMKLTEVLVIDSAGDHYSPVASVCGLSVYISRPLGEIKASLFAPGVMDIGTSDGVAIGEQWIIGLLYEIPAEQRWFRLKIADGEPIPVKVNNKQQ